ncbi:hypothetical protein [Actinacidiphila glaucinigra]|uniref:hypothetical protein n=1 Tax=Actinacidiphila glaucinigra TaxID=235986 RepID=UPI0035DB9CD2
MRAAAARAGQRLGYRGIALLIAGVGWINYGLGLLNDPRFGVVRGVGALTRIAPLHVWAWVWLLSGLACCGAAVLRAGRDWWGWVAAAGMPAVWAFAYTSARALGEFPQGWYSGITWGVTPGLLAVLAAATRRLVMLHREVAELRRTVRRSIGEGGRAHE